MKTRAILSAASGVGIAGLAFLLIARGETPIPGVLQVAANRTVREAQEREEQALRAREDLEILELQLGAKQVLIQKAELRVKLAQAMKAHVDQYLKLGVKSQLDVRRAEMDGLEADEHLARAKVEYAATEARFRRARRRVERLQQDDGSELGVLEALSEDLDDLRLRTERLEAKIEVVIEDSARTGKLLEQMSRKR